MTIEKEHADAWIRCIRDAGGSAGVSRQAVALAALNGLFDLHRIAALPWHSAPPEPTEATVKAVAEAIQQGVCETCGRPAIGGITPQDCGRGGCYWGPGTTEQKARAAIRAMPLQDHAGLDKEIVRLAAEAANKLTIKWMPERWLSIFVDAYDDIAACRAAPAMVAEDREVKS